MAKTADVVIIGAGVMGASIAFNLARRGVIKRGRLGEELHRRRRHRQEFRMRAAALLD